MLAPAHGSLAVKGTLSRGRRARRSPIAGALGRWLPLAGLTALLALFALVPRFANDVSSRSAARAARPATGAAASSLPLAARGPISASLGAASPAYRLAGAGDGALRAANPAQGFEVQFSRAGARVREHNTNVGLDLRAAGYGRALTDLPAGAPSAHANRVSYARGEGLSEWYANGPLGLEQGFTVARSLGAGASGAPLTLSLVPAAGTHVAAVDGGGALKLQAGAVSLAYSGLDAVDASGRQLHSWMAMQGTSVLLRVDTAGARYPITIDPMIQTGKLTGGGREGEARFGLSVALSADGSTALVGGPYDHNFHGAVWVFTRSGSDWTQQGSKLTGSEEMGGPTEEQCLEEPGEPEEPEEEPGECSFGTSVALSADGNTALIGDPSATTKHGTVWVYTRSGSSWSIQSVLSGPGEAGEQRFGKSVALSSDGNTALVGDPSAEAGKGAAWLFTRTGSSWSSTAQPVLGGEPANRVHYGRSVALSADGNTALVGDPGEVNGHGSAWVLTHGGAGFEAPGTALRATGENGASRLGTSVALSGDGNTALLGGPNDGGPASIGSAGIGAAWVFTRSGSSFTQQGEKLSVPEKEAPDETEARFGRSVALSGDGNTALIGAPRGNDSRGVVRRFTRSGANWTAEKTAVAGAEEEGHAWSGASVALSASGEIGFVGAPRDNHRAGAAWGFEYQPECPANTPIVEDLSPHQGAFEGGTRVKITGLNLCNATAVMFGSAPARSFTVKSPVEIEAESPGGPECTEVEVRVASGEAISAKSAKDHFFYGGKRSECPGGPGHGSGSGENGGGGSGNGTNTGTQIAGDTSAASKTAAGGVLGTAVAADAGCTVSLSNKRLVVQRYSVALLRLRRTGFGACKGTVTLRYKVRKGTTSRFTLKTIGKASFSIAPGTSKVVAVTLNKAGRKLFKARGGKLNASIAIVRATPRPVLGRTASVRLSIKKTRKAKP